MGSSTGTLPAPMPDGVTREVLPSGLRLTYAWFKPAVWFLLFFCVIWDGFIVLWYSKANSVFDWSQGLAALAGPQVMFLVLPLLHVAAGAAITYFTLCSFVNRTTIDVSPREIAVRTGPLPWFGDQSVAPLQVAQIFREQVVHQTKNGESVTYQLSAALKNGRKLKLLSGLTSADQALYLEQEIERHLGIRDQPVAGEMRK